MLEKNNDNKTPRSSNSIARERCPLCRNTTDQRARHTHFLRYEGDLAQHLREHGTPEDMVGGILAFVRTKKYLYGPNPFATVQEIKTSSE